MVKASGMIAGAKQALAEDWGYIWGKKHELWTEAKQAAYAKAYADDPNRGSSAKYGKQWIGHWVTDCSGLIAYLMEQQGGKVAHGSDTMYRSWCAAKGSLKAGKRTDGEPLKPGTAVFCWNGDSGKYSHVGLYVGDGKVIEAAGARQGVIQSQAANSKWKYWGELKGVEFDGEPEHGPDPEPTPKPEPARRTLKRGNKGEAVKLLQEKLTALGYSLGICGIDGDFGLATETAVKKFQKDKGLKADGICGPLTWAALDKAFEPENWPGGGGTAGGSGAAGGGETLYTVTLRHLTRETAEALINTHQGGTIEAEV